MFVNILYEITIFILAYLSACICVAFILIGVVGGVLYCSPGCGVGPWPALISAVSYGDALCGLW